MRSAFRSRDKNQYFDHFWGFQNIVCRRSELSGGPLPFRTKRWFLLLFRDNLLLYKRKKEKSAKKKCPLSDF